MISNKDHKNNILGEKGSSYFPQLSLLQSGFEGCEKRLFVDFEGKGDLRTIKIERWKLILQYAKCSVLNIMTNNETIAFLLSESSLFVYEKKMMIKTCGTTTLLHCLPLLLKTASSINLAPVYVQFSRSNFMFPQNQPKIHRKFENEVNYMNKFFDGSATVLGPLYDARWHVYVAGKPLNEKPEKTLEIVMFNLDEDRMQYFFKENLPPAQRDNVDYVTAKSGIKDLLPKETLIDAWQFSPCGYSLNGILGSNYWTIHVTPEPQASFISFETNSTPNCYQTLVSKIISTFKPKRFSVAITSPGNNEIDGWEFQGFSSCNHSSHRSKRLHVTCGNWVLETKNDPVKNNNNKFTFIKEKTFLFFFVCVFFIFFLFL